MRGRSRLLGVGCWVLGASLLGTAFAQQALQSGKLEIKKKEVNIADTAPVTQSEARATFQHLMLGLPAVAGSKINVGTCSIPDGANSVTREEVLQEMDRLYQAARPFFKYTPRPVWDDPSAFTIKSGPARSDLEYLAKGGFVAIASPLATSTGDTLTVDDFGDAVGIFGARLADVTHMPDTKYSPNIRGDDTDYHP